MFAKYLINKKAISLIFIILILWVVYVLAPPIVIKSDGLKGINIRVLPIRYGLFSSDYMKNHRNEFWPGGCITSSNDPKWVVVY